MGWKTRFILAIRWTRTCTTWNRKRPPRFRTPALSLEEALDSIDHDREFLTRGGVFSNDLIDAYIALKMDEVTRFRMTTHPLEFDMYYSS